MTASHPAGQTGGAPSENLDDLRHDVEDSLGVAAERGRGFAAAARSHAQSFAEGRKSEAARSVADLAQSIRDSGRTFDDRPNIRAFFDSAAEGLDDLAGTIEKRSFGEFYEEAEAFARRSPVAVAAATFAAGFLLARFVKSSGSRERDGIDRRERV